MTALTLQQAFDLARQHHAGGRLAEAESICRLILAQEPQEPQVLHMLGLLAHQVGNHTAAIDLFSRAIAAGPPTATYHSNLGLALLALGRVTEAVTSFQLAISIDHNFAEAHNNLGNALRAEDLTDAAIESYRAALAINPRFAAAHVNLGNALRQQGRFEQAIAEYRAAIEIEPRFVAAWVNAGNTLRDLGRIEDAIAAFRTATQLEPGVVLAHFNLAIMLKDAMRIDESIAEHREVLRIDPNYAASWVNLGIAALDQADIEQSIECFRRALLIDPGASLAQSSICYAIHFHPDATPATILAEHQMFNERFARQLTVESPPHANHRDPDRLLRVGYLSPNFREHPVTRFLLPLLEQHDHEKFKIFAYSDVTAPDAWTDRVRSHCDVWRDVRALNDEQIAQIVRDDQIDILIDLAAHMRGNHLMSFARKPAPVQAAYLSYCSTTGLEAMDYRFSDTYLDPAEVDVQRIYVEKTIRLESYWCYQSIPDPPPVNDLPASGSGRITFGCLNNFAKTSRQALETWCRILNAIPGSRLILHAHPGSHRQRVLDLLATRGVDPSRLRFVSFSPLREFLALHHQIDIALDPFPYNGGTTNCDALWMGVPVITLNGRTAVGRGGASVLHQIGLPELIAQDTDQYVKLATSLASDIPRLANLRSTLRQRMLDSPLMDAQKFARDVEACYRKMWMNWCEGRKSAES